MYKVFIDNKPVVISDKERGDDHSHYRLLRDDISFKRIVSELRQTEVGLFIMVGDSGRSWESFCSGFAILEAAGGIVKNEREELLMILRLGKWDLPKGKIEKGETPSEAALREVCEETGVCDLRIVSDTPVEMYHTYSHKDRLILKRTYWFNMRCNQFNGFKLQKEEDIHDAAWKGRREVDHALGNSYASIIDLLSLDVQPE